MIESAGYIDQAIASWSVDETRARVARYDGAPLREPGLDIDKRRLAHLREIAARPRASPSASGSG